MSAVDGGALRASYLSDTATVAGGPSITPNEVTYTIPPNHTNRTLVLCFDGTGDQFDSDNSNIVELFTMLKKDDRDTQVCYYQAGIGTYTTPAIATPLAAKISKAMDEAIAWNLSSHVMQGYEFLMQTYKAGDRICIFGFSRGAYTARGLAGMIHKVGLLPTCNHQQVPFAYKMFTRTDEIGWKQSNAFKKAFSIDVKIEFLGVWDTVNSVGLFPRRLPFTTSNSIVRTFRHAVALDERRAKFKANHWNRPSPREASLGIKGQKPRVTRPADEVPNGSFGVISSKETGAGTQPKKRGPNGALRLMESQYSEEADHPTDIEEVWFAGCHCDIGGGSVDNGTPNTLARISLRWMIRECFKADTGIMFISSLLPGIGLDPASLYPFIAERPPALSGAGSVIQRVPLSTQKPHFADTDDLATVHRTEEEHELLDALSPIYDQLDLAWFWWWLEIIPFKQRWQRSSGAWETSNRFNLGRGRFIPRQKTGRVRVHRSVRIRMEAEHADGAKYVPQASFATSEALGHLDWVD